MVSNNTWDTLALNYEDVLLLLAHQDDSAIGSASEGTNKKKGITVAFTTEDMQKRRNGVKARTTLLLALPDEHQLRFSKYKTAQELWAAILKTFIRNKATKKTKKNQLKQQYGNFKAEGSEILEQTFNRLQAIRNKSDLDTMSLDDLYNHLKVYEPEVQKKSESNSQNMAFISLAKNNSGNGEANTASILTVSTQVFLASVNVAAASISLDTACAYIAFQSNGSQIKYEDINQIDEDDIEEMDIKECRTSRSQDRGRRENFKQGSKVEESAPKALMAIDGVGWDWSYMANEEEDHALVVDQEAPTEFALIAKSSSDNDVEARLVEFKNQEIKFCEKIRGLEFKVESKTNRTKSLTKELKELKKEKEGLDSKLTGFQTASKGLDTLLGSQRSDKNKEGLGYSVVPPPAQVYFPLKKDMSWIGLPEFADDTITDYSRPSPTIEPDSPIVIKINKDEIVRKPSVKYVEMYRKTSKSSNVRGMFKENKQSELNLEFQEFPLGNSQNNIDDKCYWDSGCSRHITGNISYLSDYEPFDGGYVSFGQGGCKITGKGMIKTSKPEFENVYFVKDLKYNLFSVSQICDNKNSVLFTDSECIVLGRDFKLKDDTNVLLRTPKKHNMYSIDLNNIVPHKDLTCLVAKASADKSELWHRRLGHLKFKTMKWDQEILEATPTTLDVYISTHQKKRKTIVAGAREPSHPPKKLREDHKTLSGASIRGKSRSMVQRLLVEAVLNAEVMGGPIPTLLFVTSSVSATPERVGEGHTDSMIRLNLQTPSTPVIIAATVVNLTTDHAAVTKEKIIENSLLFVCSALAGGTDPAMGCFTDLSDNDFLVASIRTVISRDTDLQKVYVPQWSITNGSCLDDGRVSREMVDEFTPLKFFAFICGMAHNQLFTEFNVGAAKHMSLSAEVSMHAEYNIKENRRLASFIKEKNQLLKSRDELIKNLKAQLLLKQAEAADSIRLCAKASKFEVVKRSLQGEVETLKEHNTTIEKKKNELDVKVVDLAASVKVKEQEVADFDVVVYELEVSFAILREKVSAWLLTYGMKPAIAKYLNSSEYISALAAAIGKAIEKGMQDGLAARIIHGKEAEPFSTVALEVTGVTSYTVPAIADTTTAFSVHKASCKTKLVHSVTKPLHTLHIDLFGSTSDKTSGILRNFITKIENLKDLKIKIIRCDNGSEFRNKEMNDFYSRKRIKREFSNARTPQQNGIAERRNMTLIEAARTMEVEAKGDEGTKDAASQDVKKGVSSLRYITLPNWFHEAHLESSTSNAQDACKANAPESSGNSNPTATLTNLWANQMETLRVETLITTVSSHVPTTCLDDSPQPSSDTRLISKRVTSQDDTPSLDNILTLSNRFEDILGVTTNTVDTNRMEADLSNIENNISASPTPTFRIHKDHPTSQIIGPVDTPVQTRNKSKEMEEQSFIASIHHKTNPDLLQPIGTKWVLKNKKDERGIMIRNKARLVAQGHTQEEGIDYEDVFAPVARIKAIRLFLAYASFMRFTDPKFLARVYKVEKAMYRLHQAPRAWYGTLSKYLLTNGFQRGTIDQTLFIRKHKGDFLLVQVYVDDIIFGSSNPQLCREFKALTHEKFQMSAMGELNFFLGLQVLQKKDGIFLSQDKYVDDILKKFGYSDVRPGIMFAVYACARHQVTPKECHLHVVKRIFRYLKGHPKLGIWYPKDSPFDLVAYSDSDYGGATQDRKSTTRGSILEKYDHNVDFHQIVDFVEASHIRYALTINPTVYVSHIRQFWSTARIETTDEGIKILATVDGKPRTISESSIRRNLKLKDEARIGSLLDEELFENLALMGPSFSGRTVPLFDSMLVHQGEGSSTPTEPHHTPSPEAQQSPQHDFSSSLHPPVTTKTISTVIPTDIPTLRQYSRRARIAQSSALPTTADEPASPLGDDSQGEALPTVFGLEAGHDMENIIKTSTFPHDSPPRVTSLAADEGSMKHKLNKLTDLVKLLEDKDRGGAEPSREDATIKGRSLETEEEVGVEKSTERGSNDTEELVNVLTSLDAASILTSGVQAVSVPPAAEVATISVPTSSGLVSTASPIFTTASVVTPYSRRKGKEKMVESDIPKKRKLQEQIDVQVAREMKELLAREDQRMDEQIARDAEIATIHAEEELQMLIDSLDRNNETIAKYLQEYEQFAEDLSIEERIEFINDLVKYQDNYAKVLKYQSQQRKPLSKNQQREFYMSVLKSHSGWKTKHFKGMSLEEIREKFIPVWKQIEDFVHMASKKEGERFKRKGLRLEQSSAKKMKTAEDVYEEDLKEMMQLVPVEEHLDREDLNQLWTLVKETLSIRQATSDKEKKLWVELKRLYQPDVEDQLWTQTQALMYDPMECRLYDTYGVHHVLSRFKKFPCWWRGTTH
nr:hypothetical protein [Tanacetum cinerariifolium]